MLPPKNEKEKRIGRQQSHFFNVVRSLAPPGTEIVSGGRGGLIQPSQSYIEGPAETERREGGRLGARSFFAAHFRRWHAVSREKRSSLISARPERRRKVGVEGLVLVAAREGRYQAPTIARQSLLSFPRPRKGGATIPSSATFGALHQEAKRPTNSGREAIFLFSADVTSQTLCRRVHM